MTDETIKLSAKSWARTIDSISKAGYSDGVVDGQAASFQSSFDVGYKQGFEYGFSLGIKKAMAHTQNKSEVNLEDPQRINCQICLNTDIGNDNVVNLFIRQQEKNNEQLNTM